MISFLFSLDHHATAMHEAAVRMALELRFPDLEFVFGPEVIEGYENSIVPVRNAPHPTDPDGSVMVEIPPALIIEVRQAFHDILAQTRALRPN
jgi:hypothetical protein